MIKIQYPENKKKFESDYIKAIDIKDDWNIFLQKIDCCVRKILVDNNINSFEEILLLPFDKLLTIFKLFPEQKVKKDTNNKKIKTVYETVFNYETLQPKISKFFMDYSEELNLKTCYFCNIDYINSIHISVLDILQIGNEKDLKKLDGINTKATQIIKYREKNKINSTSAVKSIINHKTNFQNMKNSKIERSHFTLDHFLPKAKCPILALSLYNFIPSCSACNSRFKGEDELLETYLSPTSKDFSVNTDIKFKLFIEGDLSDKKFKLELTHSDISKDYVNTFKLKGRYASHQDEAIQLLIKKEKYSESQIKEMADILKISPEQIKKDIFGKELFDGKVQDKSFSKLKRDIAKELRLT